MQETYEMFKTGIQGMQEFPENVAIVTSVNPEAFDPLPSSVQKRFVTLKYELKKPIPEHEMEGMMRANAEMLGMDYNPLLLSKFRGQYDKGPERLNIVPRDIYNFLLEEKALQNS